MALVHTWGVSEFDTAVDTRLAIRNLLVFEMATILGGSPEEEAGSLDEETAGLALKICDGLANPDSNQEYALGDLEILALGWVAARTSGTKEYDRLRTILDSQKAIIAEWIEEARELRTRREGASQSVDILDSLITEPDGVLIALGSTTDQIICVAERDLGRPHLGAIDDLSPVAVSPGSSGIER